jgi:hypothetical protein
MENWLLALLLKPFVAVIVLLVLHLSKLCVKRYVPESRIKDALLSPVFHRKKTSNGGSKVLLRAQR